MIWANGSQNTSNLIEKNVFFICIWHFYTVFPTCYAQERIAPVALRWVCYFLKEQRERFALVLLLKRATVSESFLWLFTKKRLWAIRSCHSWKKSYGSDLLFLMSESLFCSQKTSDLLVKTDERIPNPGVWWGFIVSYWMYSGIEMIKQWVS